MNYIPKLSSTYPVADFYAGIVATTFQLETRDELQNCMVPDADLTALWDATMTHWTWGKDKQWQTLMGEALQRTPEDFEPCLESGKLRAVGRQLDAWWGSYFDQGEVAHQLLKLRKKEKRTVLAKEVVAMRLNWETGYFYDAGRRFGNIWSILIGAPEWTEVEFTLFDQKMPFDGCPESGSFDDDSRYPLADFYASMYEELYQENYYDELQQCLIPDDLHMHAHDLALGAINPRGSFEWEKYFKTVRLLNSFNFIECAQVPGLGELMSVEGAQWETFWSREDHSEIMELNLVRHYDEMQAATGDFQMAWECADAVTTGAAYGHFFRLLFDIAPVDVEQQLEL